MKHRAHGAPASCLKRGLIVIMTLSCIILNSTTYTETKTAWNNSTDQLYFKSVKKCNKISNNCNNNPDHVNYHFKRPDPSGVPPAIQKVSLAKSKLSLLASASKTVKTQDSLMELKLHSYVKTKLPPTIEKIHIEDSHLEPDSLVKVQCGHDIASSGASQPHEHLLDPDNHNNNHLIYLKYYSKPSATWMLQLTVR